MPYGGDPANDSSDAVRFHAGDTNTSEQLLADGEVTFLLSDNGDNILLAAAAACDAIAAKFSRQADAQAGDVSRKVSQRAQAYSARAVELRQRAMTSSGSVYAGGISDSDKETVRADTDRVRPAFHRDLHVNGDGEGVEQE